MCIYSLGTIAMLRCVYRVYPLARGSGSSVHGMSPLPTRAQLIHPPPIQHPQGGGAFALDAIGDKRIDLVLGVGSPPPH